MAISETACIRRHPVATDWRKMQTAKQICNLSLAGYINGEKIHA